MAKIDLKFLDAVDEDKIYINCKKVEQEEFLDLIEINLIDYDIDATIWLDKSTAIKFAKTLRTEINKIQE